MVYTRIWTFQLALFFAITLMKAIMGISVADAEAEAESEADSMAESMAEAMAEAIAEAIAIADMSDSYGQATNYSNQDDGYGKTWMYIPDGNGVPQVAYLKEETTPSRGRSKDVKEHVRFELYTKKSKRQPKVMQLNKRKRRNTDEFMEAFNKDLPTYIIVHGWKSSTSSDTVQDIKDNYLNTRECNVIAIDWNELASNNFYFTPARQTRDVGKYIAEMIDFLCKERGADIRKFHLIGHSLGAHTVGYAGMYTTNGRIPRITGLDPAKPMFEDTADNDSSLDKSDGEFVDVIHSCGGLLGYAKPLGHVDFYPNGGRASQPGCGGLFKEILEACSHGRSHQFFAASIFEENVFTGYKCRSYESYRAGQCKKTNGIRMGDPVPLTARGIYFLQTSDSSPYAQGR